MSLKGNKTGETTLSVRIYTPIGFINQGSNTYDVNAEVKGVITLKLTLDKQIVLLTGETKSVPLKITNQSNVTINGLIVGATSGNDAIMTVGEFNSSVDIYQNDSVVIDIPLNANSSATGTTNLVCSLTPPAGYENEGDNNITSTVTVTAERELEVLQEFQASWAGEGGYLYSYMLTLKSQNTRVNKWELSFQLPSGAVVSENWYESQKNWLTKVEVDGNVILSNTTGHTIDPGVDLPLQIQLVYPDQSEYYKYIYSLSLRQIQ